MKNKGAIIAIAVIAVLVIELVVVAIKLVTGIIGGAFDFVLGAAVVVALVAIVIWMFAYAKFRQKK